MPPDADDRRHSASLEVQAHARRIAGGLNAFGLQRGDVVAVLLHNDPVYLSIAQACRIGGCRLRQISPHSTTEQIRSALAEPGIRAVFVHEGFLAALDPRSDGLEVVVVTPLSLFPGSGPARSDSHHHRYHQWLPLQAERNTLLRAPRGAGRRAAENGAGGIAVSGDAFSDCRTMLEALTRGAGGQPPLEDGASPHSAGNPEID